MHEMAIARSVMEATSRVLEENGLTRLDSITLRIGELTAVEPSSLRFCFQAIAKDTPMEDAVMIIEEVPYTARCRRCARVFTVEAFAPSCPSCESTSAEDISGRELDIVSLEGS